MSSRNWGAVCVLFRTIAVCRFGERQRDAKHRTAARVLIDGYAAPVHVDRPFRDRQTEPGPATLARAGIIEPEESFENPLPIRSANTRTLIDELDNRLIAVGSHAN